jgi:hypothetical protein
MQTKNPPPSNKLTLADKFARESREHLKQELSLANFIDPRVQMRTTFLEHQGRSFELVWLLFSDGSYALQNYGRDTLMVGMMTSEGPTGP